ncbi:hypothetical protein [Saccharibacillus sacchari]|uniref:Uncharacterized protein n=1 Tax=Saccharibacillus sacchari TaxID=456493 RepID=A0ACC6P9X6_9BACL
MKESSYIQKLQPHNNAWYLAESFQVPKNQSRDFKTYYKNTLSPLLDSYQRTGDVGAHALHRLRFKAEKHGEFEAWSFLLLIEVRDAEVAKTYLAKAQTLPAFEQASVVRRELLVSTPESNYPNPTAQVRERNRKPFFAVEYVDVQQPYLNEFREIMIRRNGPAMRHIMEHTRWCHSMVALETVEVWESVPQAPSWNQIHVIGLYPESFLRYKKDFASGLAASGSDITFEENFGQLKKIRTMLYKTVGSRIGGD